MSRPIVARTAVLGLVALALSSPAWAGLDQDPAAGLDPDDRVRRSIERVPDSPDQRLSQFRLALYDHLLNLGLPAEPLRSQLTLIEAAAQLGQTVDSAGIATISAYAPDLEASERAMELLTAWAELLAFGAPQTYSLDVQGAPPLLWSQESGEIDPGVGGGDPMNPMLGGICAACPTFNFGPFVPPAFPAFGTHMSSIVPSTGDCNWYTFTVVIGRQYVFKTCGPEGAAGWDTVLELYDPIRSCVPLSYIRRNDNCTGAVNGESTLTWDADFTGTVHLQIKGRFATSGGAYTLAFYDNGIQCESCPVPGGAFPAMSGACQCLSSTTSSICPSRYFSVPLVAGECYTFTTCPAVCNTATATFNTVLSVYDPTCARIATNNDSCTTAGQTTRSTVSFTALSTGTHRIQVTGNLLAAGTFAGTPEFGSFTLCGKRDSPAGGYCAAGPYKVVGALTPTPACQDHSSTVSTCADAWYQFNLTFGGVYEFTSCIGGAPCGTGNAQFDSVIELFDPACNPVPIASDDDGCGTQSLLTYPTGASGTYRLRIRPKTHADGLPLPGPVARAYTLTYREVSPAGCTPPTAIGISPTMGTVALNTCSRLETFNVNVDAAATTPITYTWTITSGTGTANLPAGVVVSGAVSGAPASFQSTLTGEGLYSVSVTATNACGSWNRVVNYTLSDMQLPVVTAPPDEAVACHAVPPATNPPATDNCDPMPSMLAEEDRTDGPCLDTYSLLRTWTATDNAGNMGSDSQTIAVSDTQAPTLIGVPPDASVPCDAVPAAPPVTATDLCDPNVTVEVNDVITPGPCPGNYTITRTWSAEDRCGNAVEDSQVLTVFDDVPPVVTPNENQIACLWPPNHWYQCFQASDITGVMVSDNCSLPVTWRIVSVSSSDAALDPCGDGNIDPDATVSPDGSSFCVQAERCGQSRTAGGRVYSVEAIAIDACGNESLPTTIGTVFVPHDQRGGVACQRANTRLGRN